MFKNSNSMEANQLAVLQAWPRIWTLDYQEQIHLGVRALTTHPRIHKGLEFYHFWDNYSAYLLQVITHAIQAPMEDAAIYVYWMHVVIHVPAQLG